MLQLRDPSGERNHKRKKGKEHKDKSVPPRMRIWYKEQVWDKITPRLQNTGKYLRNHLALPSVLSSFMKCF